MLNYMPFEIAPLKKQTIIQKIIKKQPKINALIELNNLLSSTANLNKITIEQIENIGFKYKVNIQKRYKNELNAIYTHFLKKCLMDKNISEDESKQLNQLKFLLNLDEKSIKQIHKEASIEIYNESIEEAICDGKLDEKEKEFLKILKNKLLIPDEIAKNIYSKKTNDYLQKYLENVISDERLSPEEDNDLHTIANNLGVTLKFDEKTKTVLDKYRLYWLIENGDLPVIEVNINLQKNEKCYFTTDSKWYEYRRVTQRVRYGGPTMRIKIAKGLYWRAGDLGVQTVSDDTLTLIDSGQLFLTNKRIIFIGRKNTKTINHTKVLDFTPFNNGVEILKDAGKSPFIEFSNGVDIFSMILGRVIRQI